MAGWTSPNSRSSTSSSASCARSSAWRPTARITSRPCGAAAHPPQNWIGSGDLGFDHFVGLAQYVAAAPHGLDVILAVGREAELLAQLADEHVDDLELGLVHAALKVVEEHFLGQRGALAEREQLQHRIFLAGQVDACAVDFDLLGVEGDRQLAVLDHLLRMALRA